jgi:hypothetical protein
MIEDSYDLVVSKLPQASHHALGLARRCLSSPDDGSSPGTVGTFGIDD